MNPLAFLQNELLRRLMPQGPSGASFPGDPMQAFGGQSQPPPAQAQSPPAVDPDEQMIRDWVSAKSGGAPSAMPERKPVIRKSDKLPMIAGEARSCRPIGVFL